MLISTVFKLRSEELLGFPPTSEIALQKSKESIAFPKAKALSDSETNQLSKILKDFYMAALNFVEDLQKKCRNVEERNQRIKKELSIIDDARITEGNNLRNELGKAREAILALSDVLNESAPVFEDDMLMNVPEEIKDFNPMELFESEEDKDFYLKLMNIEEAKEVVKEQKDSFEVFKKRLIQCTAKDLADQLADEFLKIANKQNRKSLIGCLCNYSKHVQQLPFFARVICTIGQVLKEVPNKITGKLESEYHQLQDQADPTSVEIRIRNIRFLAEFMKFQIVQPLNMLNCFEKCLSNFSGESIVISCHLLNSCGKYLCRHPWSSERMNLMINRMMRLKEKKHLSPETEHLIEEAVFTCRPKERLRKKKQISQLYEFIKYEFTILNTSNVQEAIRSLLSCPIPESEFFLAKAVFKSVRRGKISNLPNISKVLAGLKTNIHFYSSIVFIVDLLCEDILTELKLNDFRKAQYRILMIKFYGELHCYNIIDCNMIFKMLFTLLNLSTDTFRVKLIWALLDTVKDLLSGPQYKAMLKPFLNEFRGYILSKPGISIELEFLVMDLLEMFRSQKVKPDSLQPAKIVINEDNEAKKNSSSSGTSSEEENFDEEFKKIVDEETSAARVIEAVREKEIPTIFADGGNGGFRVLLKKAGKVQMRQVQLPESDPLIKFSEERSKTQAAEREKLSRVVVDLHQRRMLEDNK